MCDVAKDECTWDLFIQNLFSELSADKWEPPLCMGAAKGGSLIILIRHWKLQTMSSSLQIRPAYKLLSTNFQKVSAASSFERMMSSLSHEWGQ